MVCKVSNLVFWKPNVTQHPPMHQLEKTHFGFSCGWNPIQPLLGSRWVLGKNNLKLPCFFPFFTFFWGFFFLFIFFSFLLILLFFFFLFSLLCSNKFIEQLATLFFLVCFAMELVGVFLVFGGAMEPLLPLFYHCKLFSKLQWLSIYVSLILEHFLIIKFMWPLIVNDDNKLVTHYHHWFFSKKEENTRRRSQKKNQKKEKKKKKKKKEKTILKEGKKKKKFINNQKSKNR